MDRLLGRRTVTVVIAFFLVFGMLGSGCASYVQRSQDPSFDRVMTGELDSIGGSLSSIQRYVRAKNLTAAERELNSVEVQWASVRQELTLRAGGRGKPELVDHASAFDKSLADLRAAIAAGDAAKLQQSVKQFQGALGAVRGDLAEVDLDGTRLWIGLGLLAVLWVGLTLLASVLARWRDRQRPRGQRVHLRVPEPADGTH